MVSMTVCPAWGIVMLLVVMLLPSSWLFVMPPLMRHTFPSRCIAVSRNKVKTHSTAGLHDEYSDL